MTNLFLLDNVDSFTYSILADQCHSAGAAS